MKASGITTSQTAKESLPITMDPFIKGSSGTDCLTATASQLNLTATFIKEIGSMTCNMDMAKKNGVLGGVIRVNIEKAKSRARESTHGPTVLGIKETGLII
jgi:hypothetical protein